MKTAKEIADRWKSLFKEGGVEACARGVRDEFVGAAVGESGGLEDAFRLLASGLLLTVDELRELESFVLSDRGSRLAREADDAQRLSDLRMERAELQRQVEVRKGEYAQVAEDQSAISSLQVRINMLERQNEELRRKQEQFQSREQPR